MKKATSLFSTVSQKLELDPASHEFRQAYAYCLSYLTNGRDAYNFGDAIRPFLPKRKPGVKPLSAKVFRLHLLENKYNYFTIKLFILQLSSVKLNDLEAAKSLAKDTGVLSRDAGIIIELWAASPKFKKRIKSWVKSLPKGLDLTVKGLDDTFCRDLLPEVMKKIKSVTYNRLRFICKSQNMDFADMYNELLIKSIQTYYKVIPDLRGERYVVNYVKVAVEHRALTLIEQYTTAKSGRLINTGVDGNNERVFSLRTVSENQMSSSGSQGSESTGESAYSLAEQEYCASDPTEKLENEISVSTILKKYSASPKKRRLIMILMGGVDEEFTAWLQARKYCKKFEDNSDLQERLTSTDDFRKLISQFLHVSDDQVNVFILDLRRNMSEKNDVLTQSKFNEQRAALRSTRRQQTATTPYTNTDETTRQISRRRTDVK